MELNHNHIVDEPIVEPAPIKGLRARLAAFLSRKLFGRVLSPIPVLYTRNPAILSFSLKIERTFAASLSLSETEKALVRLSVSLQNGCSFCGDMALAHAFQKKLSKEKFTALVSGEVDSDSFTDSERALLHFVQNRLAGHVDSSVAGKLKEFFSPRQIVDIGWAIAAECYYNTLALTFGIESDGLVASSRKSVPEETRSRPAKTEPGISVAAS
ncbi:MAG: carboxymuconolactone decarboxylase family protein [Leptospiraceae bacterium]|nr:carboxymuconolactone decarboxylase family protein [Leptospiraceae bacterium]